MENHQSTHSASKLTIYTFLVSLFLLLPSISIADTYYFTGDWQNDGDDQCFIFGSIYEKSGMVYNYVGLGFCVFDNRDCSSDFYDAVYTTDVEDTYHLFAGDGDDVIRHADYLEYCDANTIVKDAVNGAFDGKTLLIYGDDGADDIYGCESTSCDYYWEDGNYVADGRDGSDSIYGTPGDDSLWGGAGIDYMYGYGGDDTMRGYTEGDLMWGGDGDDYINGQGGSDVIVGDNNTTSSCAVGESCDDELRGENGNDFIYGGTGIDCIYGGNNNDYLYGNAGTCNYINGRGNDVTGGDTCQCGTSGTGAIGDRYLCEVPALDSDAYCGTINKCGCSTW